MKIDVIIPCGGSSTRMGADKLLLPLDGGTVIARSAAAFMRPYVQKLIVPCPPQKRAAYAAAIGELQLPVVFCDGGDTRTASVRNALALCDSPYVAIHDGARPFVTGKLIDDGARVCEERGSAVPCVSPSDSVRIADGATARMRWTGRPYGWSRRRNSSTAKNCSSHTSARTRTASPRPTTPRCSRDIARPSPSLTGTCATSN